MVELKLDEQGLPLLDHRVDRNRTALGNMMRQCDEWKYRYMILASVLEDLGYSTRNVREAGREQLQNGIFKLPEQIVVDFQMNTHSEGNPFRKPTGPKEAKPI